MIPYFLETVTMPDGELRGVFCTPTSRMGDVPRPPTDAEIAHHPTGTVVRCELIIGPDNSRAVWERRRTGLQIAT